MVTMAPMNIDVPYVMSLYDSGMSFIEIAYYAKIDEGEVENIICSEIAKSISELT